MSTEKASSQKKYVEKMKKQMGETEYNALMAQKKREYRARLKQQKDFAAAEGSRVETKPIDGDEQYFPKEQKQEQTAEQTADPKTMGEKKSPELFKIFDSLSPKGTDTKLQPITIENYIQKINRISMFLSGKPYHEGVFDDAEKTIECIKEHVKKSQKDYVSPISRLLKFLNEDGKYDEQIKAYQKQMAIFKLDEDKIRKENMATDDEKEKFIPLSTIQKKIEYFKPANDNEEIYKLIASLYFMGDENSFVPRNNLPDFKLVSSNKKTKDMNPEHNYIVIDKDQNPLGLIMNRYKTQSTYGRQKFTFSKFQRDLLRNYIRDYNKQNGDFLFVDKNGKQFKHQNFNDLILCGMGHVLGKRINIDLIRKILITDHYKNGLHSIAENEKFHHRFLHSPDIGREYVKLNFSKSDD
jgi:hypothetical protein